MSSFTKIIWTRISGSKSLDEGNSVAISADGCVTIGARTSGQVASYTNSGNDDFYITQYDQNGNVIWISQYGHIGFDNVSSLSISKNGDILASGVTFADLDGFALNNSVGIKYKYSGFLMSLKNSGLLNSTQILPSPKQNDVSFYIALEESGYFLYGETPESNQSKIYIQKFNSSNVQEWATFLTDAINFNAENYKSIALKYDDVLIAGDTTVGFDGVEKKGLTDIFITKLSSRGDKVWTKIFGSANYEYFSDVIADDWGNFYIIGRTYGNLNNELNKTGYASFVTKLNPSGEVLWTRLIADSNLVSGSITSSGLVLVGSAADNVLAVKFSAAGELLWREEYGSEYIGSSSFYQKANDVATDNHGNIYITGITEGGLNGANKIGNYDAFLIKLHEIPLIASKLVSAFEDTEAKGDLSFASANENTLTFIKVTDPSNGSISLNELTGIYTYTPAGNYNGSDSFTFKVNDGTVDSAVATVSITVAAVNDAPDATAAVITTDEDTAKTGTLAGTDVDGNTLTFTKVADPSHGTVEVNSTTGAYTYTPNANYNGSDSFTFKVNDGTVDSAVATVSITVAASKYDFTLQAHTWRGTPLSGVRLSEDKQSRASENGKLELTDIFDSESAKDGFMSVTPINGAPTTAATSGVTLTDVLAALKIYLGKPLPDAYASPYNYIAADFDGNGSVNLTDVLSLLKFYLGKTTTVAPAWVFVDAADVAGAGKAASILRAGSDSLPIDATHTQPHAIDQDFSIDTSIELVGVLRGDVDGSWTAGS